MRDNYGTTILTQLNVMNKVTRSGATTIVFIGPSGVRALPLAAGIKVGGHYKWHFFLSLSLFLSSGSLLILPEGVVVGIQIFAWAPKKK